MTKTVKELIEPNIDREVGWFNQEINYYDLLEDILQAHKNEISEKDKEIEYFKDLFNESEKLRNWYEDLYEDKQLYKEDFETKFIEYTPNLFKKNYVLKDNSDYEKLESKEEQE